MDRTLSHTPLRVLKSEIAIVVAVAVGPVVVNSVAVVCDFSQVALWNRVWHQGVLSSSLRNVLAMLLVLHLIWRSNLPFRTFGLRPRLSSVPLGVSLAIVIGAVKILVPSDVGSSVSAGPNAQTATVSILHELPFGLSATYLLSWVLTEELIVRAYLMTRIRQMDASWLVAIAVSTLVQASYHLHHGFGVLGSAIAFLLLSSVFAWRKDFWALVIAHTLYDLLVLYLWL